MIATDQVLFDGRIGSQRLYVWVDWHGMSLGLMTHEMGPALEHAFGKDEIETWLLIDGSHLDALTDALRAEAADAPGGAGPVRLVVDRFRGEPQRHDRAPHLAHGAPYPLRVPPGLMVR